MHKRNPTSQISNSTEPQLTPWQAAVTLARLYGIAETLHPWPYLENEPFHHKIKKGVQNFYEGGATALLLFFEQKIPGRNPPPQNLGRRLLFTRRHIFQNILYLAI